MHTTGLAPGYWGDIELESPERKKNSLLESNNCLLHVHRICPSENCQGLSTKKDVQKYPKKEQQKDLHMSQKALCSALPGARMEDAPRKSLKL